MKFKPSEAKTPVVVAASVVITVIVVLVAGVAIKGLASKLNRNNQIITRKRAAQEQLTTNLESLAKLKEGYNALGKDKDLILRALPTKSDFPAIVATLEKLSAAAGVNLISLTPAASEPAGQTGASPYRFTVTLTSNYDTFKNFLENIEVSLRPMAVASYSINATEGGLSTEVEIVTYFQPEFDTTIKKEPLFPVPGAATEANTGASEAVDTLNPSQGVSTP